MLLTFGECPECHELSAGSVKDGHLLYVDGLSYRRLGHTRAAKDDNVWNNLHLKKMKTEDCVHGFNHTTWCAGFLNYFG